MENEEIKSNAVEERMTNLNKRAKEAEEAKAQALKEKADSDAKVAQMEKENNFLNSFTDISAKFPGATEFKDKIREKVMSGYSAEDATVSILHSEGKLSPSKVENVSGGSAPNQLNTPPTETLQDLVKSGKVWETLKDLENKGERFK